jgi:hypothetical protein
MVCDWVPDASHTASPAPRALPGRAHLPTGAVAPPTTCAVKSSAGGRDLRGLPTKVGRGLWKGLVAATAASASSRSPRTRPSPGAAAAPLAGQRRGRRGLWTGILTRAWIWLVKKACPGDVGGAGRGQCGLGRTQRWGREPRIGGHAGRSRRPLRIKCRRCAILGPSRPRRTCRRPLPLWTELDCAG